MCSLKQPLFIYQLGHVFALRGSKKRLKRESILAWFHFPNFLSFLGHVFVIVNFCLMIEGRMFYICVRSMSHFSFTKSRSLKIRYHVPSTVEPGKESLTSTLSIAIVRRADRPRGRSRQ